MLWGLHQAEQLPCIEAIFVHECQCSSETCGNFSRRGGEGQMLFETFPTVLVGRASPTGLTTQKGSMLREWDWRYCELGDKFNCHFFPSWLFVPTMWERVAHMMWAHDGGGFLPGVHPVAGPLLLLLLLSPRPPLSTVNPGSRKGEVLVWKYRHQIGGELPNSTCTY